MKTMKTLFSLLFAILLASSASSQEAPQLELTGSLSNPNPHHGETVQLVMKLTNAGPSTVTALWIDVWLENSIILESDSPFCHPDSRLGAFRCATGDIPAGTELDLSVDIRFSNSASSASIQGEIETFIYSSASESADEPPAEWSFDLDVPIAPLSMQSDVAVTMSHEPLDLPLDHPATLRTIISNFGPDDVSDVLVFIDGPSGGPGLPPDLEGATCTDTDFGGRFECSISFLAAGAQVVIQHSMPPRATPTNWVRRAALTFPDRTDPDGSNNRTETLLRVGSGQVVTVLIPLVIEPTEGARGSHWISELSLYVDDEEETFFYPLLYPCPFLCAGPPVSLEYLPPRTRVTPSLWALQGYPGYLLRFDRRKANDVSFSHRIRDTSRELDTWGTEVPVVREEDFLTGRTHLIDVASGERFRQTLRLYIPDGTPGTMIVRVYGENGTETLIGEKTVFIAAPPDFDGETHASYAQIDLHSVFEGTTSYERLRVEIEPDSGDTVYWTFVSITNNDTQHVTLVTPQ